MTPDLVQQNVLLFYCFLLFFSHLSSYNHTSSITIATYSAAYHCRTWGLVYTHSFIASLLLGTWAAAALAQIENVMCANAFRNRGEADSPFFSFSVSQQWEHQQPPHGKLERRAYYSAWVMRSIELRIIPTSMRTHTDTGQSLCVCACVCAAAAAKGSSRVLPVRRSPDGDAVWSTELFDTDSSCCCPVFKWRRTTPAHSLLVLIRLSLSLFLSPSFIHTPPQKKKSLNCRHPRQSRRFSFASQADCSRLAPLRSTLSICQAIRLGPHDKGTAEQ